MKILILESTCDETAAAIVNDQLEVLAAVVASQQQLHERYRGVVPELAARAHVERILPVIQDTLNDAGVALDQIDAIAVAHTPGLAGSLLVGVTAAKALSVATGKPLVAVNHLQGHIYACRMTAGKDIFPCVGMVVSGGHSSLYRCQGPTDFELLGGTIDDAAGEAFDKVAAMLGLPYPGGPSISKAAAQGNPKAFAFPRPMMKDRHRLDFSFSGLKTAVRYEIAGNQGGDPSSVQLTPDRVADIAASFQQAVVDCLAAKAVLAMTQSGASGKTLCVGGGVAANQQLRRRLEAEAELHGFELIIAPPALCTDNAVMGAIALEQIKVEQFADLDLAILPGLQR